MPTAYAEELDRLKEKLAEAQEALNRHKKGCQHIIERNPETGTAVCKLCEKDFGPWCEKSKDHVHHYDDEIIPMYGRVEFNTGESIGIDISKMRLITGRAKCIFCDKSRPGNNKNN